MHNSRGSSAAVMKAFLPLHLAPCQAARGLQNGFSIQENHDENLSNHGCRAARQPAAAPAAAGCWAQPRAPGALGVRGVHELAYNDRLVAQLAAALQKDGWRVRLTPCEAAAALPEPEIKPEAKPEKKLETKPEKPGKKP